jgi:hypothetical protein
MCDVWPLKYIAYLNYIAYHMNILLKELGVTPIAHHSYIKPSTYFHNDNKQINISNMHLAYIVSLLIFSALTTAAPTSPNLPFNLKAILSARYTCASYAPHCGAVTAANGVDAWFGKGDCIPLGDNIKEIFVGHCYCVPWETCTGDLHQDAPGLVGAMSMCEGPTLLKTFRKMPRFVSCGGEP